MVRASSVDCASEESGDEVPLPVTRKVGRPRRLTLSQIVDTAVEMGLGDLKMGALAARLNVRVAVLYTYVSGRAELVRLAAQRAAGNAAYPEDRGRSWQDFAMQYAEANHRVILNGQMVSVMLDGDLSPAAKVDSSEHWLEVMLGYGFTADEALTLLGSINLIVLGGAVVDGYIGAISKDEADYRDLVRTSVACRPPLDVPHLLDHVNAYVESSVSIWRTSLDLLFKSIEKGRKKRRTE